MSVRQGALPTAEDVSAFIRTYIIEGIPRAFVRYPIVYDCIRSKVSKELGVMPTQVCLTGSAKLGFSLNPEKWMVKYSEQISDLNFFIISDQLFLKISQELQQWETDLENGRFEKLPLREKRFWDGNIARAKNNVLRGFVDPRYIACQYKWVIRCEKLCREIPAFAQNILPVTHSGKCSFKTSFRVYESRNAALRQIKLNIDSAISKVVVS